MMHCRESPRGGGNCYDGATDAQVERRQAVLAWARALGEFGATITFAGNLPGETTTIPLEVFLLLESGHLESAVALSLVLLAVSVAVLAVLRDRWIGAL